MFQRNKSDNFIAMKWFTFIENKVEGPYTTEALLRKKESGDLSEDCLVWGPLQVGWKSIEWWEQALPHLKSVHSDMNAPQEWFLARHGQRIGPLLRPELIRELKTMIQNNESVSKILVWTKGLKKWAHVVEFHDLLNELGIDQRKHPRAKASGKVTLSFRGQTFTSSLKTISEGGLGADPIPMVILGEEIQISIESDDMSGPVTAKAEVRYANEHHLGLQFLSINSESKSNIVSFIRGKTTTSQKVAA